MKTIRKNKAKDKDLEAKLNEIDQRISELTDLIEDPKVDFSSEIAALKRRRTPLAKKIYANLTPWQTVQVARHAERPLLPDFIKGICSEFIDLHGDRCFGDDPAMMGGFATIDRRKVMLIGMSKGRTVEEKIRNNFGMANPEGYRKALRLMKLAEKYGLPVVCLIDTPAAYPGREAEERGQAEAIARNLTDMASLEVPVVVLITGEGGSGGALGIAVGDAVLMLAYSVYSVIPPEGCAAILWRDAAMAPAAAEALKITAPELLAQGIIDEIVPEPAGGAHHNPEETIKAMKLALTKHLALLAKIPARKLVDRRYDRYARIGKFDSRKYTVH